ncbi:Membrane glycoprotein [Minicystis rosea]|nr:Membrane glycoprotein [Minicystis rosea]
MTRVVPSNTFLRKALALSFAVHGVLLVGAPLVHSGPRASETHAPPQDRWTGSTAELPGADALVDVSVEGKAEAPPPPAKAEPPAPAKHEPSAPAKAEPAPHETIVAAPAAVATDAVPSAKPAVVASAPAPRPRPRPLAPRPDASAAPRKDDDHVPEPRDSSEAHDNPVRDAKRSRAVASNAEPGKGSGATGPFGAEGPASVRDLGRAFTRAIPPACDSDPIWATLSLGDVGKLEIAIRVDADGHITSAEPLGTAQPKALVNVLRRTIPMLQAGTFAVREGGTSEGTEILELRAQVTEAESADEGKPNQLAFEYARGRGKARFTQSSGRHVEIALRVVRVEAGR